MEKQYENITDLADAILIAAAQNNKPSLDNLMNQFREFGAKKQQELLDKGYTMQEILSGSYLKRESKNP